jgi:hypothetical protein
MASRFEAMNLAPAMMAATATPKDKSLRRFISVPKGFVLMAPSYGVALLYAPYCEIYALKPTRQPIHID